MNKNNRQLIDPDFQKELDKFGSGEWNECFHCGNCTAVCNLTEKDKLFPRKEIRLLQLGLKDEIKSSTEPWLCHYCGECSEKCPRQAQPGELMMSLRRYLISSYDWTGISKFLYANKAFHIIFLLLIGLSIFFITYLTKYNNTFETYKFGHALEQYLVLFVACIILLPGLLRMYWYTILKDSSIKVPFGAYITGFGKLIVHAVTQKDILKCGKSSFAWFRHWVAAGGYILMLAMVIIFDWYHTANGNNILLKIIAYAVFGLLSIFSAIMIITRLTKKEQIHKFSELSDWLFPIWLFMLAFTGLLSYGFRHAEIIGAAQAVYLLHIIVIAQWALLIVPFTKWAHIIYRPFGIYFAGLKNAGIKR